MPFGLPARFNLCVPRVLNGSLRHVDERSRPPAQRRIDAAALKSQIMTSNCVTTIERPGAVDPERAHLPCAART